jgi:hypothetical protein
MWCVHHFKLNFKCGIINILHGLNHLIHSVIPYIPLSKKLHDLDVKNDK